MGDLIFKGWGDSSEYEQSGLHPAVAGGGGDVVEVHQAIDDVGPLWYRVGEDTLESTAAVKWGNSFKYEDRGLNPAVAVGMAAPIVVVEVHQAGPGVGPLWHRVGRVDPVNLRVTWGNSRCYEISGLNPALATPPYHGQDEMVIVEVHQARPGVGPLWYRVGRVDVANLDVTWGDSFPYENSGLNPALAAGVTTVLEAHQAGPGVGPLWCRAGGIDPASLVVTWGDSFLYEASGLKPALAAAGTAADFLEAHQAMEGVGPLWYRIGQLLEGNRVVWSDAGEYDSGMRPALTAPENYRFVEVHQAGFSVGPLWNRFATWDAIPFGKAKVRKRSKEK